MDHKNWVMKSKSSPDPGSEVSTANTKSWSSARVRDQQAGNSKKRGVYVERKANSMARAAPGPSDVPKAPKRSRRGEKNFLNSCLSILSQDTTSTQFPEEASPITKAYTFGSSKKDVLTSAETVDKAIQDLDAIYSSTNTPLIAEPSRRRFGHYRQPAPSVQPSKQRKPRFRSRALSENFIDKNLVVLQAKKAGSQTPSVNSSRGSRCRVGGRLNDRLVPSQQANVKDKNKRGSNDTNPDDDNMPKKVLRIEEKTEDQNIPDRDNLKSAITMSSTINDFKKVKRSLVRIEEPSDTLVNDYNAKTTNDSKKVKRSLVRIEEPSDTLVNDYNAKNKSLYNFFVDLLETTCSVYNVETDFSHAPSATFEIDEKVAKKLSISESPPVKKSDVINGNVPVTTAGTTKKLYFVTDDGVMDKIVVYQSGPNCREWEPPVTAPSRRDPARRNCSALFRRPYRQSYFGDFRSNLKSESFQFHQQLKLQAAAKAESFVGSTKKTNPKTPKNQDLLTILKKELKLENNFEEPENFYQSLAIIAKNKKRTQRALHKDDFSDNSSRADKSKQDIADCFKARKIIGTSSTMRPRKKKCTGKVSFMDSLKKGSGISGKYSIDVMLENKIAKKREFNEPESEVSCHSIEVKGYDYLPTQHIRRLDVGNNEVLYTSNSGVSLRSETVTSSKDYLDCLQNCGKSLSHSDSSHTMLTRSTTISQLLLRDVFNMY